MLGRKSRVVWAVWIVAGLWSSPRAVDAQTLAAGASTAESARATIDKFCVGCHNARAAAAGQNGRFALDDADLSRISEHPETWEKVIRKLRAGLMPPTSARRPDPGQLNALVTFLETTIDAQPVRPGRTVALHRLNRDQYRNAVRDMLHVDVDVSSLLPADDASFGFDNIGGVLRLSPVLLERYLAAARYISALALGRPPRSPVAETFRIPSGMPQHSHRGGLPLGTRGGVSVRYHFPADGTYEIHTELARSIYTQMQIDGLSEDPHDIEVNLDGVRVAVFPVVKPKGTLSALQTEQFDKDFKVRLPVKAGPHEVAVAFLPKTGALVDNDPRQPFFKPYTGQVYTPQLGSVSIAGPFTAAPVPLDLESRRQIMVCQASNDEASDLRCARRILQGIARRAYRRPVTENDMKSLLTAFSGGRAVGGFEGGIEQGIRRVLMSADFLFRIEHDHRRDAASDGSYRVSDVELASRLSFFLWNSVPDPELLQVAEQGQVRHQIQAQMSRMLGDRRARNFVSSFAGQWLYLRNLSAVQPNEYGFPDFDDSLRDALRQETELFFESVLRENRPVTDLLTADYTYLNERLAKHYGVPGVYGSRFRRVSFPDNNPRRGVGLLGHGSILTATSYANRTSPVKRGSWILENILGTPPPPPPPNIPPLPEAEGSKPITSSMRDRMAQHRKNPTCATCHAKLDPIGFAMENFDAVGHWRDRDGGAPIDATGDLPDGTRFDGPAGLRKALMATPERFVTVLTEKLLVYALGRGLEPTDMPTVRSIVTSAARDQYRFQSLIAAIINSAPFTMRSLEEVTP